MVLWSFLLFALSLLCTRASAQSVISAHAGLIHLFEGAVFIDGRPISPVNGRFPEIPEGALLVTHEGRAEILLAPAIFFWLGHNSAIRMQRNSLADTRIELLEGSAIVQSAQLLPDSAVTLIHRDSQVRLSARSLFRIDASTGVITHLPNNEPDGLEEWALERGRAIAAEDLARVRTEAGANPARKSRQRRPGPYRPLIVSIPRRPW